MPKPNCPEKLDVEAIDFGRLGRRVVQGRLDGGSMTSDGGVMLLGQLDRKLGLMDAAARCIADPRSPLDPNMACVTCCASACMRWRWAGRLE